MIRHIAIPLGLAFALAGCDFNLDDVERSPYGMSVILGDNLAALAEEVGPLIVVSTFESRPADEASGGWLFSDGTVGELCFDSGQLWVRNTNVHMRPDTPEWFNGNAGTSSGRTAGSWTVWDETDKDARRSELDLRLDEGAPCSLQYTLGVQVIPISDPYRHPDAVPPEPFFCKQEQVYRSGYHVSIAEVPAVPFNDGCANTFVGEDHRGTIDTDDSLVDRPERYPPGAPRPPWLSDVDGGVADAG